MLPDPANAGAEIMVAAAVARKVLRNIVHPFWLTDAPSTQGLASRISGFFAFAHLIERRRGLSSGIRSFQGKFL